ncbi:MAG: hypothetical protein AAF206_14800 [Bacteroidota bacterium]
MESASHTSQTVFQPLLDAIDANTPLILIEADEVSLRDQAIEFVLGERAENDHLVLDLSKTFVQNLSEVLQEKLPAELLNEQATGRVVHSIHLEGSLLVEAINGEGKLMTQLAETADKLSTQFPFCHLIWMPSYLLREIQAGAASLLDAARLISLSVSESDQPDDLARVQSLMPAVKEARGIEQGEKFIELAEILIDNHREQDAQACLEKALASGQAHQHDGLIGLALLHSGRLQAREQDMGQAVDSLEKALQKLNEAEDQVHQAEAHRLLGVCMTEAREWKKAVWHFQKALQLMAEDKTEVRAAIWQQMGRLQERIGGLDAAIKAYETSAALVEENEPAEAARCYQQIGAVQQNQLRWLDAYESFQQALKLARRSEDTFLIEALEDSVEDLGERREVKKARGGEKGKKGLFGKLFGG